MKRKVPTLLCLLTLVWTSAAWAQQTVSSPLTLQPQDGAGEGGELVLSGSSGRAVWLIDNTYDQLRFFTQDSTIAVFHANGSMGLGTNKLYDGYRLSIAGAARAHEMVVQAEWPDYVFEDDYVLIPLREVAAYIAQHGHLPEVPSAAEVEANGVSLGANQALLLKKIEEMTLYLIEMQQQNDDLRTQLTQLQEQVNALAAQQNRN